MCVFVCVRVCVSTSLQDTSSKTIRQTYFRLNLLFSCTVHTSATIYNTNNNSYQMRLLVAERKTRKRKHVPPPSK